MNEKEVYEQNEYKANLAMSITSLFVAICLFIVFILTLCGVNAFSFTDHTIRYIKIGFPIEAALLATPICTIKTKFIKSNSFKYFVITYFALAVSLINFILPKDGILLWSACIAVGALYFNPKVTRYMFILTSILMLIVTPLSMFYGAWDSNMLSVSESQFATLHYLDDETHFFNPDLIEDRFYWVNNFKEICETQLPELNEMNRWSAIFVFYFLPRFLTLVIIAQLANGLSIRTKFILDESVKETKSVQKITSELSIASEIQATALPQEFPDSINGELYAIMDPAKEIGGDLYDFFKIDDTHTALVIGDASGKGVPASLFMMKTQSLVRALAKSGKLNTAEIMSQVNNALCEGNGMNMFVTCWIGIIDKENSILRYTNAGHNPPIIKSSGKYSYLSAKPGLVLAGRKDFPYEESELPLRKGDRILLYTDGVTEAHNVRSELYGEERLLNLVSKLDDNVVNTIKAVREDVREFSRNTEQFDDITMLMAEHRVSKFTSTKQFEASAAELENVQNFIIDSLNSELTTKDKNELLIVIEEIFINIASYSYEGKGYADIEVNMDNGMLTLAFKDNGVPFDPLKKQDPNVLLEAGDRQIGGLGIFMVKNLMDKVFYQYKDGKNILTLMKKYK